MNQPDYSDYPDRQRAFLEMVKTQLSMLDAADNALDNKLMALVGLSGLSLSLASLAISTGPTPPPVTLLVVCAFGCLILMVLSALWEWRAADYFVPGPANTESAHIYEHYLNTDMVSAYNNLIAAHQNAELRVLASTVRKGKALNAGLALYSMQLLLLAGAVGAAFGAR